MLHTFDVMSLLQINIFNVVLHLAAGWFGSLLITLIKLYLKKKKKLSEPRLLKKVERHC